MRRRSHFHHAKRLPLLMMLGVSLYADPARAEVEFVYSGPAISIPDNQPAGVNVVLIVSGLNTIKDVDFRLVGVSGCDATPGNTNAAIDHTAVGDLVLKLTSPAGTEVVLIDRRGGTRENFCTTFLDDDGNDPSLATITSMSGSAVVGAYRPDAPLTAFDGQNPVGQWLLNVSDHAPGNSGSVRRFALVLDTEPNEIEVDVLDDPLPGSCVPGSCSLREAVGLANVQFGPDRILLPASGDIVLTRPGANDDGNSTGDLDILGDLEIVGAGASLTTITQTAVDRVFHLLDSDAEFTLRDLRIVGGGGVAQGGAIRGGARLLVEGVQMSGHRASTHGGAIYHSSGGIIGDPPRIILRDSVFDDNRATNSVAGDAYGGALYSFSAGFQQNYLLIENCTFSNNRADNGGGALALDGVQSVSGNRGRIYQSLFSQNQVSIDGPGGAIATNVEGNGLFTLDLDNLLFEQNSVPANGAASVGGAVATRNSGVDILNTSFFIQNTARVGGALHGDVQEIVDSTLCLNTATDEGGALRLGSDSSLIRRSTLCQNSVSTGNAALAGGGAISKQVGNLELERSTLHSNSALRGGAISFGGDDLRLASNTMVAPASLPVGALGSILRYTNADTTDNLGFTNNVLIGQCSYSNAGINPDGAFNNIEASGNTCRFLLAGLQAGNQIATAGAAINLAPLANNGGPTNTSMPLVPSVAIDAGSNLACSVFDQRGYQRTDAVCDIGSTEASGVPLPDLLFADGYE